VCQLEGDDVSQAEHVDDMLDDIVGHVVHREAVLLYLSYCVLKYKMLYR